MSETIDVGPVHVLTADGTCRPDCPHPDHHPMAHFSRSWSSDPFAPACGCEVASCGHVVLAGVHRGCDQHDWSVSARTIRSGHPVDRCPGDRS